MIFSLDKFRRFLHAGLAIAVLAILVPALSNTLWVAESPAIIARTLGLIPQNVIAHPLTLAYYRLFAFFPSEYTPLIMAFGSLLAILASSFLLFLFFRDIFLDAVAEATEEELEQAAVALDGEPEEDENIHTKAADDDDDLEEDERPDPQESEADFKRGLTSADIAKPRHFAIAEAGAALLVLIFCCSAPVRLAATTVNTSCIPLLITALVLVLIQKFSRTGVYFLIYLALFVLGATLVESVVFVAIVPVLGIYAFVTAFRTRGLGQRFLGNLVLFSFLGVFAGIGVVMGGMHGIMPFSVFLKQIGLELFREMRMFIPATRWLLVIGGALLPPALMAFAMGRLHGAAHRSRGEVWQANICALCVGLYCVAALSGPDPIPFGLFLSFAHIPLFSALFLSFAAAGGAVFAVSQFCAVRDNNRNGAQAAGDDDEEMLVQDIDDYENEDSSEKVVFRENAPEISTSETASFKWMQVVVSAAVIVSAAVSFFLNYNAGNPRAAAFIDRAADWILDEVGDASVLLCDSELELQIKIKALLAKKKLSIFGSEISVRKLVRTFKDLDETAPDRKIAKWLKDHSNQHSQLAVAANPMVWYEAGVSYYPSGMFFVGDVELDDEARIAELKKKNDECWEKIAYEKTDSYREHTILSYYRSYFLYRQSLCK